MIIVFIGIFPIGKKSKNEYEKDKIRKKREGKCHEGRTYTDLQKYLSVNKITYYFEMGTTKSVKGGEVLLTFILTEFRLLLAYKIKTQTIEDVNNKITKLKNKLGYELFYKLFHTCATDNSKEFKRPEVLKTMVN